MIGNPSTTGLHTGARSSERHGTAAGPTRLVEQLTKGETEVLTWSPAAVPLVAGRYASGRRGL